MVLFQDDREKQGTAPSINFESFKDIKSAEFSSMEQLRNFGNNVLGLRDTFVLDKDNNYFPKVLGHSKF